MKRVRYPQISDLICVALRTAYYTRYCNVAAANEYFLPFSGIAGSTVSPNGGRNHVSTELGATVDLIKHKKKESIAQLPLHSQLMLFFLVPIWILFPRKSFDKLLPMFQNRPFRPVDSFVGHSIPLRSQFSSLTFHTGWTIRLHTKLSFLSSMMSTIDRL